jgi:hypothetical protein
MAPIVGIDFTLIDQGRATQVDATLDGARVLVADEDVARATGWQRRPEGMCRDDMCVPLRDASAHTADRVELNAFAAALRRPLAVDTEERAAFIGTAAVERAEQLSSLRAPDFTLPDLDGRMHSLGEQRGRKVLLVVYASW